jgi:hypothetical protein
MVVQLLFEPLSYTVCSGVIPWQKFGKKQREYNSNHAGMCKFRLCHNTRMERFHLELGLASKRLYMSFLGVGSTTQSL